MSVVLSAGPSCCAASVGARLGLLGAGCFRTGYRPLLLVPGGDGLVIGAGVLQCLVDWVGDGWRWRMVPGGECHTQFLCQNQVLIVCMIQDQLFHTYG
jgi:hypothetical protein